MKHSFALAATLMAVSSAAFAGPVITDGNYTAWIGSQNYLYLQNADGYTMYLQSPVIDLIGINPEDLFCVADSGKVYAVRLDGSDSSGVSDLPGDLYEDPWKLTGSALTVQINGVTCSLSTNASFASRVGSTLYYLTEGSDGTSVLHRQSLTDESLAGDIAQVPFIPVQMTVTRDAAVLVGPSCSVTVIQLPGGAITNLAADSQDTVAAMVKDGTLFRYAASENGGYIVESQEELAR